MVSSARPRFAPPVSKPACALASLLASSACHNVLDIPDEPQLVGPWTCLDQPLAGVSPERTTALVRVQACNFVSTNCAEHVVGLTAALCSKRDVNCATPIRTDIRDNDGEFVFEVETGGVLGAGFDGFLSLTMPAAKCTDETIFGPDARTLCSVAPDCDPASGNACEVPIFTPALLFFNPPIKADVATPIPLPVVPSAAIQPLIEAAGGSFEATTGYLFISSRDCGGSPAAGVTYSLSRHEDVATVLYLEEGVVSNTAVRTDASGLGGFLGVPAGFVEIDGLVVDQGQTARRIGGVGVQVAPFTISYATVSPSL